VIVLARDGVEVHLHVLQTMTEQFQLLGKLHRCLEITSGSWDAPDYPACPYTIFPSSNSAMKGNNGTNKMLYYDTAAQTITEPIPCFTLKPGIPDYRLPWVFSKHRLFLM
jgi:hypothetical protein